VSQAAPIKVAILWHMHQPNYREPGSDRMAMPWVRLHALKDYLDMPLMAGSVDSVKVTFNLVPSLLDQLELYLHGGTDRHLELTRIPAEELNPGLKVEILESFFSAFPANMIKPHPRYWELYNKARRSDGQRSILPALFSSVEMRDLQVWSNLAWVDPMFADEEPVANLLAKGKQFTENEKTEFLDWQLGHLGKIVPAYKKLLEEGRIEVSLTPYYHPILPLLCDTSVAQEASPGIHLPEKRFIHPEDAQKQIEMSVARYESLFGGKMNGMWPSEGSVSEEVLKIIADNGIRWAATDEEILYQSLIKSGADKSHNPPHRVYEFGDGLRLLFRDHGLSDRIGFVYSGWAADRAVADFVSHIKDIRKRLIGQIDDVVAPVILDGENAWEYFPDDGTEFLRLFYRTLAEDPEIETVTMSEAIDRVQPLKLKSLFAGSWINHNFRIWIGHPEDNAAWDHLSRARDTLAQFESNNPSIDPRRIESAWNQIYIAEGSDWNWWYGDDHRTSFNDQFDKIYRRHLVAVYELLGLEIPVDLLKPITGGGAITYTVQPENMLSPVIDGRVTDFYEWTGAGQFDCLKAGGAMHRVERYIDRIQFAYDQDHFFIRLDFHSNENIGLVRQPRFLVNLFTPAPLILELTPGESEFSGSKAGSFRYALDEILELAIERTYIWPSAHGALGFCVSLYDGDRRLEIWPETEPIQIQVAPKDQESFWPI
jgi:alpha-amylase/alpha-mannosidase (GH57 family)